MKEITFLVKEAEEGGFYAEAIGPGIFAEGGTMQELKDNINGGVQCYFENKTAIPTFAHLHFGGMK